MAVAEVSCCLQLLNATLVKDAAGLPAALRCVGAVPLHVLLVTPVGYAMMAAALLLVAVDRGLASHLGLILLSLIVISTKSLQADIGNGGIARPPWFGPGANDPETDHDTNLEATIGVLTRFSPTAGDTSYSGAWRCGLTTSRRESRRWWRWTFPDLRRGRRGSRR